MSTSSKLNKIIMKRLEGYDTDKRAKDFTLEILRFEKSVEDQDKPFYMDDYERLVKRYSQGAEE